MLASRKQGSGASTSHFVALACLGRFMAAFSLPLRDNPKAVIAADLNGDGQTDLAIAVSEA